MGVIYLIGSFIECLLFIWRVKWNFGMSFPHALELFQKTHKDPRIAFAVINDFWCRRLDEDKVDSEVFMWEL